MLAEGTLYVLDDEGRPLRTVKPLCDFTMGDSDALFDLITVYLAAYGIKQAKELVILTDAARWIPPRVQKMLEALSLPQVGVKVTQLLNFYHMVEHLTELKELPGRWSGSEREGWFNKQRKALRAGRHTNLIAAIDELKARIGHRKLDDWLRERKFFDGNAHRIRYALFKQQRLPIGSGAIESAIRRIINLRVKFNATFWLEENAERVSISPCVTCCGIASTSLISFMRALTRKGQSPHCTSTMRVRLRGSA